MSNPKMSDKLCTKCGLNHIKVKHEHIPNAVCFECVYNLKHQTKNAYRKRRRKIALKRWSLKNPNKDLPEQLKGYREYLNGN